MKQAFLYLEHHLEHEAEFLRLLLPQPQASLTSVVLILPLGLSLLQDILPFASVSTRCSSFPHSAVTTSIPISPCTNLTQYLLPSQTFHCAVQNSVTTYYYSPLYSTSNQTHPLGHYFPCSPFSGGFFLPLILQGAWCARSLVTPLPLLNHFPPL